MDALSLDSLQAALERCMTVHPPAGLDRQLHADASSLAGLWGLMLYERATEVPIDSVSDKVRLAYRRWSGDESTR